MRTTLTIDDDVAVILRRLARSRNARMKDLVNETLRRGLAAATVPASPRAAFQTTEVSLGRRKAGAIDNVAEALAAAEGESYR